MKHSQALENMFSPYEYEIIWDFCYCNNIYLFIDTNFPHSRNSTITLSEEDCYDFKDSRTFYFHLPEEKLYGGGGYGLFVFKHSEDEIINKFYRFMKLKAFL
jgi:hypothetical protein